MKLNMFTLSFLFIIISIVTYTKAGLQDYTAAKVCPGATKDDSKSGTDLEYYDHLKKMYTNCTYVLGNIVIHPMGSLRNRSLDFFSSIIEVSGYVRILGLLPRGITKLPFTNLRIIRGESLTRYSDSSEDEFSLFLYNANQITNLGLTALREISRGNVYFGTNHKNCYGENIDWDDIFQFPTKQRADVLLLTAANCRRKSERCHSSCKGNLCWGPGPNDCQQLNKVNCADQCDYRCYNTESNNCCRTECLAGCDGPLDTDCWGCRGFYNNGTCNHECPRATIYNKTSYSFVKNPDAKVAFGKLCLAKCPDGYLEYNEGCLLHKCPDGFRDVDGKCVECNGACTGPKECDWLTLSDAKTSWLTASFLRDPKNHNCSKIIGNAEMISASFEDPNSDEYIDEQAITVEDLKIFETVEHITGSLAIEPEGRLPTLTSLYMFRNLKTIGGSGNSGYSFVIYSEHILSFDMNSLTEVSTGDIWIVAENMCYADNETLHDMLRRTEPTTDKVLIDDLGSPAQCKKAGYVCHEECNSTCIGPANFQCISCLRDTNNCSLQCKNFEFEGQCVATCSAAGLYTNGSSCMRCHEQCSDACTGPLNTDCQTCKNYKNGNRCIPKCPNPTYADADRTCKPCNDYCNFEQGYSCSGPKAIVGRDGCESCDRVEVTEKKSIPKCLNATKPCPSGYLTLAQKRNIGQQVNASVNLDVIKEACLKCYDQCSECEGRPYVCTTSCSSIAYRIVEQRNTYLKCDLECDLNNHFLNESSRECFECSSACKGCTGTTDMHCKLCSDFKLILNDTDAFQCVNKCPDNQNRTWRDGGDMLCLSEAKYNFNKLRAEKSTEKKSPQVVAGVIVGAIMGGIAVIAIAAIIVTYFCRQKTKHMEKAKAYELQLYGPADVEPVMPTDAEPDLARLRLVKESELKRAVIIGSGAFGTVFKGFLIPEGENVKVPVAIKVLIEGTSPSQNTELLDEARVMAAVDHPCCIKIVAVCMTAQMMLITPLMPEGCLLSYVQSRAGQLGSKILINWCAQISKGMEYLQRCGIVHRDLAARNVLVHNENQVKITDFGLAKLLDVDEEYYKADSGKVPIKWMALESIQHRMFNHQTDVWSYGVTIWEILTFGQKPYDGVKARDIAILIERGERLSQPTISTIDVYMIMIKCWMLDANTRPTFEDLTKEFTKMARDPGRYLVIDGDQLKRNPTLKMNHDWMFDDLQMDDEYPYKQLVAPDDYLSPSIASTSYPRYENDDAIPPPFEKSIQQSSSADNLHSPLRYTSSPTLRNFSETEKLTVDTEPSDDYLQPRATLFTPPAVDDDGYLQPQNYSANIPAVRKEAFDEEDADEEDESRQPLLVADNSIYLSNKDEVRAHPTHLTSSNPILSLPDVVNPIYMSNNNSSPPPHKQSANPQYQNLDYVNQDHVI